MNIGEYIASGILELYVAGNLTEAEAREVEAMAKQYPEVQREIDAIGKTLEQFASAYAEMPPENLRDKIMQMQGRMRAQQHRVKEFPVPATTRYLLYAALILLFISISVNIYFYNKYDREKRELADLSGQQQMALDQYETLDAAYRAIAGEQKVLADPDFQPVVLRGQALSPGSLATVYWNSKTGDLYLKVRELPKPSAGMQYQLWVLRGDKPSDAGVFDPSDSLLVMKPAEKADAFAVTLEPQGGSAVPTLSRLYILGHV